jgi:hypothetical protein
VKTKIARRIADTVDGLPDDSFICIRGYFLAQLLQIPQEQLLYVFLYHFIFF